MESRQTLNLYITHAEKEGPFLKVWGQTDKNNSLYVEQFLLSAAQQFDEGVGKLIVPNLQVGKVVCAKYKDNKYYRVKITSVEYLNECFVEVLFLDYGNRDIVPSDNLRTIEHPLSFLNIPPLAAAFIFAETHCPGGGEWNEQIFETVTKELKGREVQCVLLGQAAQYYLVKLFLNGTDLGALFIARGLLQPIPQPSQQAVLLSMSLQKAATPMVSAPPEINTYKACSLEPGQQYPVYVSFVNDGPTHFFVQLQQSEQTLAKLMKDINELNLRLLDYVPLPGTVCLARCQEDGHICRAVVTNEVDSQYKVFYVDFGNYETLSFDNLYQIPFKYVLPKVMAIRLSLAGIEKPSVTVDMLIAFKKFVDNRLLYMTVLPSQFKKTIIPQCELWDPETKTSALDVINRAALHSYPEPLQLSRGFSQPVRVSYVFSCNRFFVQLTNRGAELAKLMTELQRQASGEPLDPADVKIGLPCCALFVADGQWYRSEIVDVVDSESVKVRYIDYGNEEAVPVAYLRSIEGELLTVLRPQAIECCLNGYQNMEPEKKRDSILEDLVLEQTFTMKVVEMVGKKALVELSDALQYNVASLLLERLATARSQASPLLVQTGSRIEHHRKTDDVAAQMERRPPARDNQGRRERNAEEQPWRQDKNERRSNNNERRGPRDGERFSRGRRDDGSEQATTNGGGGDWGPSPPPFKRPNGRYGQRGGGRQPDKRDGFKRRDQRRDVSSSGSERSSNRGPRTSSRNTDYRGGGGRGGGGGRFKDSSFGGGAAVASAVEDSWNVSSVSTSIDAAPCDAVYTTLDVVGTEAAVTVAWFHSPDHFYVQLKDAQAEFRALMDEIHQFYRGRSPEACPTGPAVALFPDDNAAYRVQILETAAGGGPPYHVRYVDYGNESTTAKAWPIERRFMESPACAVRCALAGVVPNPVWPDGVAFQHYFRGDDRFTATFLYKDDTKTYIRLLDGDGVDVAGRLVGDGLAAAPAAVEIPLLLGQQFRVVLKSVNNLGDVIIALECDLALTCKAHNLETATETREDVLRAYVGHKLIVYVDDVLENGTLDVTFYDNDGNKLMILEPDEGAVDVVEPLCPAPVLRSRLAGYVSHADEKRVYLQPAEHADLVTSLLEKMFETYDGAPSDQILPEEDAIYAVRSRDTNWYRGRVVACDDDSADVYYLDYGNGERVVFADLRVLDARFAVPHMLCVQIALTSGDPRAYLEKDVVVVDVSYGESGWRGSVEPPEEDRRPAEETTPQERPSIGAPVVISHVDSPSEFYMQFADSAASLAELQVALQACAEGMPELTNVTVGALCAAPYSADGSWYRAEVLDADDDITTVRFVDYGNTDVIDNETTRIRTLPADLLSTAVYATRCSLKLTPVDGSEWSQAALELFETLVDSATATSAAFLVQDERNNYVELYADGRDVAGTLVAAGHASPCDIVGAGDGKSPSTCFVSHLNSPSEFWVQVENCVDELEWIAERLSLAEKFPELEETTPGTLCAALFPDDEMWYRARILSNTVAGIELLFVDYGNSCISASLRQLPEDLVATAPLAQKCRLERPDGVPYWTAQAQEKFAELAADGQTVFEIKKIATGETAVVRLTLDGDDIVSKLLPVTEEGRVLDFVSLDEFVVEVGGVKRSRVSLEPMPGFAWDRTASDKFRSLYLERTVFQIETIGDAAVRLYRDGHDIRPDLGGERSGLNLANAGDTTPDSGNHSAPKADDEEEEPQRPEAERKEEDEGLKSPRVERKEAPEASHGERLKSPRAEEEPKAFEDEGVESPRAEASESVGLKSPWAEKEEEPKAFKGEGLQSPRADMKETLESEDPKSSRTREAVEEKNPKAEELSKTKKREEEEAKAPLGAEETERSRRKVEEKRPESPNKLESGKKNTSEEDADDTMEGEKTIVAADENEAARSVEAAPSRPASRLSHDERIVPAVVSRPHTPIDDSD